MDYENTIKLLDELTTRLQVPAGLLYEILLRQAKVDMFCSGLTIIGLIILMIIAVRSLKNPPNWIDDELNTCICVMLLVCTIILLVLTSVFITAAFNPEYYALKGLFKVAK